MFQIPKWLHITFLLVAPVLQVLVMLISKGQIVVSASVAAALMTGLGLVHSVDPATKTELARRRVISIHEYIGGPRNE
jgi:hypothetical protein